MNVVKFAERLAALEARAEKSEAQAQTDRTRLAKSERKLRVTWAVCTLAALVTLTIGWHKDAIAQGYGITLAQAASKIAALETKTANMTAITDPNTNKPTVRFSGVNVQIVSGSGTTDLGLNGLGNLIIGYNELRRFSNDVNTRTGSHNLVVGFQHNYSGYAGAVIGTSNSISGREACAIGGENNIASADYSSISGGYGNKASGEYASVSGGSSNTASGVFSTVTGGEYNTAIGYNSSVSGGSDNTAGTYAASVSGGYYVRQSNPNGFSAGGIYSVTSPGAGTFHSP